MSQEIRKFEAETQKVLDLMIHSLYSNKDIFLRELVSNAADAIDKRRFEALKDTSLAEEWNIRIDRDEKKKILTISDNGIGMSKEDVVENLGTIAKSGTKAFLEAVQADEKNIDLPEFIGQFGVGFYSVFMISDKVVVETKKAGEAKGVRWESKGDGEYTLEEIDKDSVGTTISLKLKKDEDKYLATWTIKEIVKKYSDFIEYPIMMLDTTKEPIKQTEEEKEQKKEIEYKDVEKDEVLNSQQAIWSRTPKDVKEEEYQQFYKHLTHGMDDAMKTIHFSVEGKTEFKALLYLPSKNPFNMFVMDDRKKSLHLYVKKIFITDHCPNLIPEYLRFIDGVVDSSDLPLNVSRETLQDNPTIQKIQGSIVKKVLDTLKKMKNKTPEKYEQFFAEFGRFIKEGMHTDYTNKEKLQELLMFETMNNQAGKLITLKDYVDTMKSEQKDIYYAIGESRNVLENSPHLEAFRAKGYDVLFMTDPIDEFVLQGMFEYDKKTIKAVGKGDVDLGEEKEDKKLEEQRKEEFGSLLDFMQTQLDENIKEVRFSKRLTDSACCLVGDAYDQSPYMERIMKSMNQEMPKTKRVLELNPEHPIVSSMKGLFSKDESNNKLIDYTDLLYNQALLAEGSPIQNPLEFTKKIADLMVLDLDNESAK